MYTRGRRGAIYSFIVVLSMSLAGCDSITSVKEYFQESSNEPPAAAVPVQKAVPASPKVQNSPPSGPMASNVLVRIGNWSVTAEEFEERLAALKEVVPNYDITNREARAVVLEELINQQILVLDAEKTGLAQQKDIQAAVDEFRRSIIVREVVRQLSEGVEVSDEEARAFYNENKEKLVRPVEWHVREIVTGTKEQTTNILGQIINGADFVEMARQNSMGKTAADGGDLGFISEEPFPQMGNALLSLEIGDVSGVFKGPEGYYVVKLEEKKGGEQFSFEEIRGDIVQRETLLKQEQILFEYLNRVKEELKVEINEGLL